MRLTFSDSCLSASLVIVCAARSSSSALLFWSRLGAVLLERDLRSVRSLLLPWRLCDDDLDSLRDEEPELLASSADFGAMSLPTDWPATVSV